MTWTPTIALAGAALVIALFSGWRGARPSDPTRGVRLVPWRPIMVLAATLFVLLVVHMANLAGLKPN